MVTPLLRWYGEEELQRRNVVACYPVPMPNTPWTFRHFPFFSPFFSLFCLAWLADGGRPIGEFIPQLQLHLVAGFFILTQVVESVPLFRHTGLVSCAVVGIWFFTRTPSHDSVTGDCPQLGYSLCP